MEKSILACAIAVACSTASVTPTFAKDTDVLMPLSAEVTVEELRASAQALSATNPSTVDVMVFYQNAHVEDLGFAELERRAQAYEAYINNAFATNGMAAQLRIVNTAISVSTPDDIQWFSINDERGVPIELGASNYFQGAVFLEDGLDGDGPEPEYILYNSYGADLVHFIRDYRESDGITALGFASVLGESSMMFDRDYYTDELYHVFGHEIGHNLGGWHEDEPESDTVAPDARAYMCNNKRTIMYSAGNMTIDAGLYSSPYVSLNEEPCGELGVADNARVIDSNFGVSAMRRDMPAQVGTIGFDANQYTVNESEGSVVVTLSRSGDVSNAAAVSLFVMPDSALQQADYLTERVDMTFDAGQATANATIVLVDDAIAESDETATLMLRYPLAAAVEDNGATATLLIENNIDAQVGDFTVSELASVEEGQALSVAITRANGSAGEVVLSVQASAAQGDMAADATDVDFVAQQVIFGDNETSKQVSIATTDDDVFEGDEQFLVTVSSSQEVVINNAESTVLLIENDAEPQPGVVSIAASASSISDSAGSVTFNITRADGSDGTISATVSVDSTLVNGSKVVDAETQTVTFDDGETSADVSFTVNNINLTSNATITATLDSDDVTVGVDQVTVTVNADPQTPPAKPPQTDSGGGSMGIGMSLLALMTLFRRRR